MLQVSELCLSLFEKFAHAKFFVNRGLQQSEAAWPGRPDIALLNSLSTDEYLFEEVEMPPEVRKEILKLDFEDWDDLQCTTGCSDVVLQSLVQAVFKVEINMLNELTTSDRAAFDSVEMPEHIRELIMTKDFENWADVERTTKCGKDVIVNLREVVKALNENAATRRPVLASLPEGTPKVAFSANNGFAFQRVEPADVKILDFDLGGRNYKRCSIRISNVQLIKGDLSKVEPSEDGKKRIDVAVSVSMPHRTWVSTSQVGGIQDATLNTEIALIVFPGSPAKIECTSHATLPISWWVHLCLRPFDLFSLIKCFLNDLIE